MNNPKLILSWSVALLVIAAIGTGIFFFNLAKDGSFCSQFTDSQNKQTCITAHAISRNDAKICNKIPDGFDREFCVGQVSSNHALKTRDMGSCSYGSCIDFYATRTGDLSVCGRSGNKDNCFYLVAIEKDDHLICSQINDTNMKKGCINKLSKKDVAVCGYYGVRGSASYIVDDSCIRDISESITLAKCREASADIPEKQYSDTFMNLCIGGIAYHEKDFKVCDQILDPYGKNTCISGVNLRLKELALISKDITGCSMISEQSEREDCENEVKILNHFKLDLKDFLDPTFEN